MALRHFLVHLYCFCSLTTICHMRSSVEFSFCDIKSVLRELGAQKPWGLETEMPVFY